MNPCLTLGLDIFEMSCLTREDVDEDLTDGTGLQEEDVQGCLSAAGSILLQLFCQMKYDMFASRGNHITI